MKRKKMTNSRKAVLALAVFAAILFYINQILFFDGTYLDMSGKFGAIVMASFLLAGLAGQVWKIAEGVTGWFELVITILLIIGHAIAELAIWLAPQVLHAELWISIPQLFVSFYWILGLFDVVLYYGTITYNELSGRTTETQEEVLVRRAQHWEVEQARTAGKIEAMERMLEGGLAPVSAKQTQSKRSSKGTGQKFVCRLCKTREFDTVQARSAHEYHCKMKQQELSTNGHKPEQVVQQN